ncbi:hva22-like protein a [Phtheirospermum japonicum]|uniref:Hva22-like protein a n=1 Tax=Phtheirospermum japonicum TaxID=374723 RepID=A0A830BIY5_9LAMI|nr:hva22-like protein a [Phtheirospermum japonicum]
MGFVGQLKFALLCIDFLAWPVIALGYPLVPFWSGIKLTAIFWLAIPRFHGACHVYNSFIRPCLVVNLQELIGRFHEEQRRANKETFIDVVDKYIKENGFEGLEKLIATKRKCKEADNSERDNQLIESDEKNDASTSKKLKEPVAALKDNEMSEASEKSVATEVKQAQTITSSNLVSKVTTTTTYAAAVTKGILATPPTQTIPEIRKPVTPVMPDPPKKLVQQRWTCHLCRVTTTCENNLNAHLRGKNHKAMVESLKLSKLKGQGAGPGKSAGPDLGGVTRHWCFACDVELVGGASLASHLNGKRHASNVAKNGLS